MPQKSLKRPGFSTSKANQINSFPLTFLSLTPATCRWLSCEIRSFIYHFNSFSLSINSHSLFPPSPHSPGSFFLILLRFFAPRVMEQRRHQQAEKEPRKGKTAATSTAARPAEPPRKCPRCESLNTKFCYYNNYSSSQPRYFCRACRRYWTEGGTLRNLPHGGSSAAAARRASKFSKRATASNSSSAIAATAMGDGAYSAPALGHFCLPPRLTHEPLYFARGGFVRQPSGYPAVEPELLAGISLPTALPRLAGAVNPSLVLGPPAGPQMITLPMERFTDPEAAGNEEDRLFNDLLGGFQDCSGDAASASRPPPTSSGPFI